MKSAAPLALGDTQIVNAVAVPAQDLTRHNGPLASALQAAAARVLKSGRYILPANGAQTPANARTPSEVVAFEHEAAAVFGVTQAIGVSSGTDALLAMLMAAGVEAGDEVVTTPFSFIATATAIARLGARPVFADIEPTTLNLDPDAAAARVGPRTKAVLTVHLFGRLARSQELVALCADRQVPFLGDAAQAIGAVDGTGRPVGAIGCAAALSFFPTKNLGGFGDGGMVLTNDAAFATTVRSLRTHGATGRFHHTAIGGNFRLDELQAALLRVKLPFLPDWTSARRHIADRYRTALSGLPIDLPPADAGCVWNQFVIRVPNGGRDALMAHLNGSQIATTIYYPEPLHLQPCFAGLGYRRGDLPIAERAATEVLALPLYPELTDAQIDAVVRALQTFYA